MTSAGRGEEPLYVRDPEAWREKLAEGNRAQPRKRVAAKVLLRDGSDRLLLVDPAYKPLWDLPGGMAEENEAPHDAALRELQEELGLRIELGRLLCVDWVAPRDPWDDLLMFVFDGGVLPEDIAAGLAVADDELWGVGWFHLGQVPNLLRDDIWARTQHAIQAAKEETTVYLHQGRSFPYV